MLDITQKLHYTRFDLEGWLIKLPPPKNDSTPPYNECTPIYVTKQHDGSLWSLSQWLNGGVFGEENLLKGHPRLRWSSRNLEQLFLFFGVTTHFFFWLSNNRSLAEIWRRACNIVLEGDAIRPPMMWKLYLLKKHTCRSHNQTVYFRIRAFLMITLKLNGNSLEQESKCVLALFPELRLSS